MRVRILGSFLLLFSLGIGGAQPKRTDSIEQLIAGTTESLRKLDLVKAKLELMNV